jgi:DNA-directed RNA polymerase specialized sigma24 family protein
MDRDMARRKLTEEQEQDVAARRKRGATYDQLSKHFGVSRGTIGTILERVSGGSQAASGGPKADAPQRGKKRPDAKEIGADSKKVAPVAKPPPFDGDDADILTQLAIQLRDLNDLAAKPDLQQDVGAQMSIMRSRNQTLALIAKLTPPPGNDGDEMPDMVAAAKRVRRKLHELLDKLIEERRSA